MTMFNYYRVLFLLLAVTVPCYCANLFLITGPGKDDFSKDDTTATIEAIKNRLNALHGSFESIGDGESDIDIVSLRNKFEAFSKGLEKPVVVLHAHGDAQDGHYFMQLGDDWISNSQFLDALTNNGIETSPLAILYGSCESHAALANILKVPVGSILIGLACGTSYESDFKRWIDAFTSEWPVDISGIGLLQSYLLQGLIHRRSPEFAEVTDLGIKRYTLDYLLSHTLETEIPQAVIANVKAQDKAGSDLDNIAQKIVTAHSDYYFDIEDYGPALALALEYQISKGLDLPNTGSLSANCGRMIDMDDGTFCFCE